MICRERNLIFVHIPKCGGSSVEDCIWPETERTPENLWMGFVRPMHNKYQTGGLQHLTARYIREEVGVETFEKCFKFAVVRDPLERLVSQYCYMHQRRDLRDYVGLSERFDFDEYLLAIRSVTHVQWMPTTCFLEDRDSRVIVDKLYRLEDLSLDVGPLNDDLGLNLGALPVVNAGAATVPRPDISDRAARLVYGMFRADYDLLGYRQPAF